MAVSAQLKKRQVPSAACEALNTYAKELPAIIGRVYKEDFGIELGKKVAEVYEAKRLATLQFDNDEQLNAFISSIDAAAGIIQASANILRSL